MNGNDKLLGIVKKGAFQPFNRTIGMNVRLTGIQVMESRSPDSAELNLREYEGSAIMVQGHLDSGWLYSAQIIDSAGPILTKVVNHLFSQESNLAPSTTD